VPIPDEAAQVEFDLNSDVHTIASSVSMPMRVRPNLTIAAWDSAEKSLPMSPGNCAFDCLLWMILKIVRRVKERMDGSAD
jgi:hypothetical protein